MRDEIMNLLEKQLDCEEMELLKKKKLHLGIFTEPYLSFMIDGVKTIESRFSKNKGAPYEKISKDDVVIVKKSSGNVLAYFTIKEVMFFDLSITSVAELREKYCKELCVGEDFWSLKKDSKYATLIVIDKLKKLEPFHINKKGMQTWIIL